MSYQFKVTLIQSGNPKEKVAKIGSSTNDPYAACRYAEHAYPGWAWSSVQFVDTSTAPIIPALL